MISATKAAEFESEIVKENRVMEYYAALNSNNIKRVPVNDADDICLAKNDGNLYLIASDHVYLLTGNPREPDLYIRISEENEIMIRNAFTTDELWEKAKKRESVQLVTGNEYNIEEICSLLLLAVDLGQKIVTIDYVEGRRFLQLLEERGACSEEKAQDLSGDGMRNPCMMYPFLHSKKVKKTEDGLFYLTARGEDKHGIK